MIDQFRSFLRQAIIETLCKGYSDIQNNCWPLLSPCLSKARERAFKNAQEFHLKMIATEMQRTYPDFSWENSCHFDDNSDEQ